MSAFVYLMLAIVSEVIGTASLKASEGFTRLVPSAVVVVGYAFSFWMLSLALKGMNVGTAYAIWSGMGTAAIAVIGYFYFSEMLTAWGVLGIGLIIGGVVILQVLGTTA